MSSIIPIKQIMERLLSTSGQTSNTVLHLSRVLSSAQGIEVSLCTLAYALALLHSQLIRLLERQYERIALSLTTLQTKTSSSLDDTIIPTLAPPQTRLAEICTSVRRSADLIEDFRIFLRLWNLLNIYAGAHELYRKTPRDPLIKFLRWTQVGTDFAFQVLENASYLAMKGILRFKDERKAGRWMAWSCRFWLASVVLEGLRLARVRQLRYKDELMVLSEEGMEMKIDEKAVEVQSREIERQWWRDLWANAAWLPLTLHWSYEDETKSPMGEAMVGACGLVAGAVRFEEIWKETA
ncbi:Hypothetical protein R9X50_00206700 [Acrodontium crateriforme]|uniref:Peroxin 11C n=1 Tax=Acrodontium crateriforme TaxID=150365 RepID=A0AAQ3M1L8_9PEZI|nr:Hypothetical protein R9X50_00206700 [Acrodontium crateriforme]